MLLYLFARYLTTSVEAQTIQHGIVDKSFSSMAQQPDIGPWPPLSSSLHSRLDSRFRDTFFKVRGRQPLAQPPTWRSRVCLLVWIIPFDLSGMGGPTGSYATAGIALRVI
jgi:hypothetical protein